MENILSEEKIALQILSIISITTPSITEIQTESNFIMMGTSMSFLENPFWAISIQQWNGPIQTDAIFNVFMPYLTSSLITVFVWLLGCISPIVVYLVFSQNAKIRTGIIVLVVITFLPFFPGIIDCIVTEYTTYSRIPLIIPQVLCLVVLAIDYWKHRVI
jgi:hypothetical protein